MVICLYMFDLIATSYKINQSEMLAEQLLSYLLFIILFFAPFCGDFFPQQSPFGNGIGEPDICVLYICQSVFNL